MYTIEDINKAKQYLSDNGYGTGSNFTLNTVANLMAEWAAKNCSIPAVIKSLPDDEIIYQKARELDEKDFAQWMYECQKGNVL